MRRLATVCLGLALAAPATAWSQASGPAPDLTLDSEQHRLRELDTPEYQQIRHKLQQARAGGMTAYYGGHVCEDCAKKLPTHIPVGPSPAPAGVFGPSSMVPAPYMARAEPQPIPPSPASGCSMCRPGRSGASGVAYVGGPSGGEARYLGVVGSIEPLPVGVIRTNYNQISDPSTASVRAAYDPYMPSPSMRPPAGPIPAPMGAPMVSPGHRRPSILAHIFGFRRHTRLSEARREREREAHAMIRYNSDEAPPTQLPASMVFPH